MIKSALSVLPTKPVVYIAPIVVAVVLSFYYWGIYTDCTNDKKFRITLGETLNSMTGSDQFRLVDAINFSWDKVRIINNFKPEKKITDCPFGWDWSASERQSLMASDSLGVLIFANEGIIVEHIDIRTDQFAFEDIKTSLSPDTAIFNIGKNTLNNNGFVLTLIK